MKRIIALLLLLLISPIFVWAAIKPPTGAYDFELTTLFKRNEKIWGTYKLSREDLKAGRKRLNRETKLVSDLVISGGELIFVRESKEKGITKVLVERIPYTKKGKKTFKGRLNKKTRAKVQRLFAPKIQKSLSRKDYRIKDLRCVRVKKGVSCTLKGSTL